MSKFSLSFFFNFAFIVADRCDNCLERTRLRIDKRLFPSSFLFVFHFLLILLLFGSHFHALRISD